MLKILILLLLLNCKENSGQTQYECGLHGRFEYCIDGIPGCVVGCHCHPGFYFDTETKICESSAKMLQDSRRYYSPPPPPLLNEVQQGVPQPVTLQQELPQLPPPQLQEPRPRSPGQSELLTEITKYVAGDPEPDNEEDLEEWLYKQFSKTIESQILHKNGNKPSRRGGGDSGLSIPKRRRTVKPLLSQVTQVKKSPGKQKKSEFRAIDENDSLFEDASSEEFNDGGSGEKDTGECKNEGKKMIIIKKAPKMPLPPFIFMPQVDGSYYPANGLAPPPPMTLFPIVPVPPMLPMIPMMPSPQPDARSTSTTTTNPAPGNNDSVIYYNNSVNANSSHNSGGKNRGGKNRGRKRKPNPSIGKLTNGGEEDEMLPSVQTQLVNSSPQKNRVKGIKGASSYRVAPSRLDNLPARRSTGRNINTNSEPEEPAPGFQYLTDLIHTFDSPTKPVQPLNYNSFGLVPQNKKPVSIDDMYFTKLGKEIVTLMNKMDNAGGHTGSDGSKSLLNPKVVWDRQVRSPSPKNVKSNKGNSNEELIHLEKDVYAAATSAPALSLAELEEKIRKVDEEFINIESDTMNEEDTILLTQPSSHLNVNLLAAQTLPSIAEKNHSGSIDSNSIQTILIHSELRHSEPLASALMHFEIRDPERSVTTHPAPIHVTPNHQETTSPPIFESTSISSIQFNSSRKNHHVLLYKNLKHVYKKSKRQRQASPKNSTLFPFISNNTQPRPTSESRQEVKHIDQIPSQVISSAVMHKEPRHSQANYSPPKIHLEHKPHSRLLENHLALNDNVVTYNITKTSVFGNSYGIFQPNDYNIGRSIRPSSLPPPSKPPPFHQHLSSYEKWKFDKQQFYYPKLTADWNDLNRWRFINEPNILPEPTTEPQNERVNTYPYRHKLYRQYLFPFAGKGIRLRNYETPSWYFETR